MLYSLNKLRKLEKVMNKLTEKENFSGVVLINRGKEEVFSGAYGYAHRGWKVKNTMDTKFGVASVTKAFTAVSILKLIEEGLLSFDTKVMDVLDIKDSKISKAVDIHQLLTHTSGIADYFNEEEDGSEAIENIWSEKPNYSVKELKDLLPMFVYEESSSKPGEKFSYCNGGYILLGLVIEKISSISYFDYVKKNIFERVEMKDTGFISLDSVGERVAEGYIPVENNETETVTWKKNIYSVQAYAASDGGAVTTVSDLLAFFRALKNGKLLSDNMTKLILEPKVIEDEDDDFTWQYGYGMWFISKDDKLVRLAFTGEDLGFSARLFYYPEQDVEVVLLSNQSDAVSNLGWYIHDLVVES